LTVAVEKATESMGYREKKSDARTRGPLGVCVLTYEILRDRWRLDADHRTPLQPPRDLGIHALRTVRGPRPSPESLHAKELDGHIDVIKP
jgi:hypothetical protein